MRRGREGNCQGCPQILETPLAMVQAVVNRGKAGYSEIDECDSSRLWREM